MKRLILILLGTCYLTFLSGMNEFAFKHLGVNEGLSNSQINNITKDSQGFMWFSTTYGLNRYDGYTFKVFTRNSKDPYSLPDNHVEDVQENNDGLLWVHTRRSGYVYFDPVKETFHPAGPLLEKRYGIPDSPYLMFIDKEKNIWSYAYNGTHYYDIKEEKLYFYPIEQKFKEQGVGLASVMEDENSIILFYSNGYFEYVDRKTKKITHRNWQLIDTAKTKSWKYGMLIDADGDYWVYGDEGIWLYYTAENRWEYISARKDSPYVLSGNHVMDIKKDAKNQIWIAINHGGINIINKNLHTIKYLQNEIFNERSILQNSVNKLYCDDNGGVWVGYYKRGISYYNESIFKFRTDHLSEFNRIKNFTPDVNVITEDKQANLWVGTSNGLVFINRETGERKLYQHEPGRNSLSGDVIVSMLKAKDGKTWIGTFRNGLNVYDGQTFTHYRHHPENPNSLVNDNIWSLAEGSNGYIWIGTLGNGLQGLDPHTGKFTYLPKPGTGFDTEYITSICMGRDGNVYMATSNGITVYSPSTNTFEKWLTNKKGTQTLSHQTLNEIYEDSRGLLWIATAEGLNIYDRKKDEIILPVNDLPLANEIIQAIIEDNNKNMWITTTSSIFNIMVNTDPRTGVYTYISHRYGELDGLQGQQFNSRAIAKTFRGEIIAGGVQGLSFFVPEGLKYNNSTPKIEFTGLQLFNQEVKIDSVYNGNQILTQSLNHTESIRLKYKQNVFSISFSAMNYILPEKTRYMYILEGFNQDWLTTDVNNLTYTNLAPGEYTLKVKAINSDGFSNHEISELKIVIEPPFWASPIAYIIYIIIVIGILLLARRQILRNERDKFKLVQIEQEAQQKHEIDDMKLRFFTNISHELRTPLTLIISPLENVIKQTANGDQKNKLEMVHRNAMRLLGMVNQLLDFRKSDVKGHQINPAQGDIIDFIHNVSNSFSEYSEKKNIRLFFFSAVKELFMIFDEDKMNKIIMNLLSNAFKFTPEGGRVDVSLDWLPATDEQPEQLEIKISDTGIGIKDEDKKLIFERFYQVQQKEGQKTDGSGIGLHLVKEFVSLHNGAITVLDNVGKGSVFIITIPIVRAQVTQAPEVKPLQESMEIPAEISSIDDRPVNSVEQAMRELPLILIVDDNEDFRLFMRDSLVSEYRVEVAADGAKAWAMIPELQPDIIVSDVMMPEMDGNELSRLVKTDIRTSHIPLILLTARSAKEQKLEGLESGADDYITKPFDFDILNLRIKKLLQLRQKRQENFNPQIEIAPSEITITSLDEKLIKKAIQYVEDNISRSELSVEELSGELSMSRVHLYKKILSITGKTPVEFIRIIRLKRAAQYLRESQQTVSEIAYQTGFSNPKFFRKYFKEEFGILPSDYQDREGK
ncbi:hybrid sensor histidine kinase/response regulator [Dysgonomonas sp. 521]|uniref:hybrid sensor histidine kinase/response regulator transcription factor n=1 Tax=Dysgonomonas sp. 521 TaxID=2302932 RepID=UPI0013D47AEB|nr:two-component regulator propeller domain-containing protein [Dysgonomonas sp. 521]NDV95121.1 hybrid sensor histidine kinase/response regulator [Dysgonomonas sp. 521]